MCVLPTIGELLTIGELAHRQHMSLAGLWPFVHLLQECWIANCPGGPRCRWNIEFQQPGDDKHHDLALDTEISIHKLVIRAVTVTSPCRRVSATPDDISSPTAVTMQICESGVQTFVLSSWGGDGRH